MKTSIKIYGAKTLERYTKKILVRGFENNGSTAFEAEGGREQDIENLLFQLHGAPQSESDDKDILAEIKKALALEDDARKIIILHRPDELKKYRDLPEILSCATQKIGLVFLGDKLVEDQFYPSSELIVKRVIPHGFFPMGKSQKHLQENPIIIGSHTTWGEMRSIKHALMLLLALFKLNKGGEQIIIGYLGGKPREELQINNLKAQAKRIDPGTIARFLNVHDYTNLRVVSKNEENVILIEDENEEPLYFSLSFNIQLYYLGNTVRMGESSGSVHTSVSVPVILEMNGAESIEELRVIKVPYRDAHDISTINFEEGAKTIFASIKNGNYRDMLSNNLKQSDVWDNTRIGKEYLNLFEELGA